MASIKNSSTSTSMSTVSQVFIPFIEEGITSDDVVQMFKTHSLGKITYIDMHDKKRRNNSSKQSSAAKSAANQSSHSYAFLKVEPYTNTEAGIQFRKNMDKNVTITLICDIKKIHRWDIKPYLSHDERMSRGYTLAPVSVHTTSEDDVPLWMDTNGNGNSNGNTDKKYAENFPIFPSSVIGARAKTTTSVSDNVSDNVNVNVIEKKRVDNLGHFHTNGSGTIQQPYPSKFAEISRAPMLKIPTETGLHFASLIPPENCTNMVPLPYLSSIEAPAKSQFGSITDVWDNILSDNKNICNMCKELCRPPRPSLPTLVSHTAFPQQSSILNMDWFGIATAPKVKAAATSFFDPYEMEEMGKDYNELQSEIDALSMNMSSNTAVNNEPSSRLFSLWTTQKLF